MVTLKRRKAKRAPVQRADGPTPEAMRHWRPDPIAAMFDNHRITHDEVVAAREVAAIYRAVCNQVMFGSRDMNGSRGSAGMSDSLAWLHSNRYSLWAALTNKRLPVVVDVVMDGRQLDEVACARRLPESVISEWVALALRNYVRIMAERPFAMRPIDA